MKRLAMVLVGLLALARHAGAQEQTITDQVILGTAGCVHRAGAGSPEGSVVGKVCDEYKNTTTGEIYLKKSGTNTNTGWVGPSALTKTDDTNVTLTLGGSASTSLLNPASLTLGWTGTLAVGRGGLGVGTLASNGVLYGNGTGAVLVTGAGGANTVLTANGGAPSFSNSPTVTNLTATGNVGSDTFVSQTTGWRATGAGALDVRYLYTDELRAKIFTADAQAVLAGSQRITKSFSTISQTFTCPAAGATATLWVKDATTFGDAAVFVSGDSVVIHTVSRSSFGPFTISDCAGVVTSYADGSGGNAGQQSWTFTRNSGGNAGTMTGGTAVAVDQLVLDYGVTGNGILLSTAVDGAASVNAPYIDVQTWATAPVAANFTTQCRYGQLKGITSTSEYGLLCGNYGANNYFILSNLNAELKNIPLRLFASSTEVVRLDANSGAPYIALGNPLPTTYSSANAGLWTGKDGSVYKFRIGDMSANRVAYDGTNVTIVSGNLTVDTNGATMPAGTSYDATKAYRFQSAGSVGVVGLGATSSTATTIDVHIEPPGGGPGGNNWLASLTAGGGNNASISAQLNSDSSTLAAVSSLSGLARVESKTNASLNVSTLTLNGNTATLSASDGTTPANGTITLTAVGGVTVSHSLKWGVSGTFISSSALVPLTNASNTMTSSAPFIFSQTTAQSYIQMTNSGGNNYVGSENSANSAFGFGTYGVGLYGGTAGGVALIAADAAGEIKFVTGAGTGASRIDTNGDHRPETDNTMRIGLATHRYTLIRGVTITSGDLAFENGWTITESYKVGIAEPGLAIVDSNNELVAFIGASGFKRRGGNAAADDVDAVPYVQTTGAERAQMDAHPEQRVSGYAADGTPIHRTAAARPMPKAADGKSNTQRKAARPGGGE